MGQALINRINKGNVSSAVAKILKRNRLQSSWSRGLVILLILITSSFSSASGLACVQCISMEDSGCSDGGGAPRECTGVHANSSYCLKSVGTIVSGNGHFVMRSCSDKPIVNCTREHMFGDLYTVCHYHCSEVGCNSGSSLRLTRSRLSSFAWVVQAIALSLWSVFVFLTHGRMDSLHC